MFSSSSLKGFFCPKTRFWAFEPLLATCHESFLVIQGVMWAGCDGVHPPSRATRTFAHHLWLFFPCLGANFRAMDSRHFLKGWCQRGRTQPAQAHRTCDRTDWSLLNDVKCLLEPLKRAGIFQVLVWETGRRLHRLHLSRSHDPGAGGESSSAVSVLGTSLLHPAVRFFMTF